MGSRRDLAHTSPSERNVRQSKLADSAVGLPAVMGRALIRVWQHTIGPMIPSSCRFLPTCSRYTYEAIGEHGLWRAAWLGLRPPGRWPPWSAGGYDPVPGRRAMSP